MSQAGSYLLRRTAGTSAAAITTAAGQQVSAQFMNGGPYGAVTAGGWTAVWLPYRGGKLAMRLDEGEFIGRDVFFQKNRLILRHVRKPPDARFHLIGFQVQALRNRVGISHQIMRGIA